MKRSLEITPATTITSVKVWPARSPITEGERKGGWVLTVCKEQRPASSSRGPLCRLRFLLEGEGETIESPMIVKGLIVPLHHASPACDNRCAVPLNVRTAVFFFHWPFSLLERREKGQRKSRSRERGPLEDVCSAGTGQG